MPTLESKVNKKILAIFEGDEAFSKAEFLKAFEDVVKQILRLEKELVDRDNKKMSEMETHFEDTMAMLKKLKAEDFERMKSEMQIMMKDMMKMHEAKMKAMDEKMMEVKDGMDADEEKVIGEVLNRIKFPDPKDPILDTPVELRDKLETLSSGEKLSIQAIQDLADKLEALDKKIMNIPRGGGNLASLISKRIRFVDDETPSGTVDGANQTFTISRDPEAGSLKLYRGGARQRVTEDYTLSGRTITITIPPVSGEILLVDYRY